MFLVFHGLRSRLLNNDVKKKAHYYFLPPGRFELPTFALQVQRSTN